MPPESFFAASDTNAPLRERPVDSWGISRHGRGSGNRLWRQALILCRRYSSRAHAKPVSSTATQPHTHTNHTSSKGPPRRAQRGHEPQTGSLFLLLLVLLLFSSSSSSGGRRSCTHDWANALTRKSALLDLRLFGGARTSFCLFDASGRGGQSWQKLPSFSRDSTFYSFFGGFSNPLWTKEEPLDRYAKTREIACKTTLYYLRNRLLIKTLTKQTNSTNSLADQKTLSNDDNDDDDTNPHVSLVLPLPSSLPYYPATIKEAAGLETRGERHVNPRAE